MFYGNGFMINPGRCYGTAYANNIDKIMNKMKMILQYYFHLRLFNWCWITRTYFWRLVL